MFESPLSAPQFSQATKLSFRARSVTAPQIFLSEDVGCLAKQCWQILVPFLHVFPH
jgi:hypothetical protein